MKKSYSNIGGIFFGLMLTSASIIAKAQTRIISGTVTSSNQPLSGVLVSQEGSNEVTYTNENGTYRLNVTTDNPVLLFRHDDYAVEKVTVGTQKIMNIQLRQKVNTIEEIILNAGYYKVKEKESTGSIARITSKDIENQPVNNVLSAIQGRMAGVNIIQSSGNSGAGFDVQIRGRNSLRNVLNGANDGNRPLYIIDGVPQTSQLIATFSTGTIPLRNINPLTNLNINDIETIEVLKDADATAIYGTRGGNGVILITTKKGKASPLKLTVNTTQSFSSVAQKMKMMSTPEYIAMREQAFSNVGITAYPANAYDVNGRWDKNRYTDWQKVLIGGTAQNSGLQLGVSGGSEKTSFLISASHQDQTTVFPGDHHYKINSISSSLNYRSTDSQWILGLTNTFSGASNNTLNEDLTNKALNLPPNAPALYDTNGNINWENNTFSNPIASLNARYENKTKQINQNLNVSYSPWKNWTFKLNSGFSYQDLEEFSLVPNTTSNPAFAAGASSAFSSSSRGTSSVFSYVVEPQVFWKKSFENQKVEALLGTTFQENTTKSSAITGTGFASNALLYNIAAATTISISPFTDTNYRYASFFTRLNYQLKNRYILNFTARRDGSCRFSPENRFANFGAVGAAWILTEEDFLKNSSWLSFAKIRGSYGRTGSDAIGDYQFTNTYSLTTSAYNNTTGLTPSRLYNPNFSWEKTNKWEVAMELSFFDGRINGSGAWYRNRSSNQLIGIPLPGTTGFSSVTSNLPATVENKGLEFELQMIPIKSKNTTWEIDFNLTIPKNKLIAFPGLEGSTYANTYVVGESIYTVKVFEYNGINSTTGQYEFTDFNNDGKITSPDDTKALRDLEPEYYGGFQNTFTYKNVKLSFLLQFVKQQGWNYFRTFSTPGVMVNQPAEFTNVWSATNPNGIIMPYTSGTHAVTNALTTSLMNSTAAIGDASFIRLKNIQLNYNVPLKNTWLREVTIYAQGQNLITWTKYFGLDPEFLTSGYLPPLKTFSMGLQLTF